mmetsp:Transcript_45/g.79  ORF Transcript_45/g.79 Transcript_45/m.79 type:complete len:309 (+) Transcript_45:773-1699(+)|eukprot:CAMPEP_0117426342 /NCGR_PEP_ID=MMETSP0758-20121206/6492_1 /TAXON_ID=63605 /ORGANISM="Percolomonas cosmopolitus, Strain AE-1 (ATCC 50343)" /LENGTH=308 /DNA_ID=CAMNT_0005211487 /DNA_START=8 /DNA_END=934 /DNA_ORIENTATION=+
MDDENPYDYDYNPGGAAGVAEEEEDMAAINLEEQKPGPPPPPTRRATPPPPPTSNRRSVPPTPKQNTTGGEHEEEEEETPKVVKPKVPWRERVICGCVVIGELPLPFVNPNYMADAKESGKMFPILAGLVEIIFCILACIFNAIGAWFFVAATIIQQANWIGYLAFQVVFAHILLVSLPFLIFFLKYKPFYTASISPNSPLAATMYGIFAIFIVIVQLIYIGQFSGGTGTGLWLAIYYLIVGLNEVGAGYTPTAGYYFFMCAYNFVVPFFWFICGLCNVIQIFSMLKSYQDWKDRRAAASAASVNADV